MALVLDKILSFHSESGIISRRETWRMTNSILDVVSWSYFLSFQGLMSSKDLNMQLESGKKI